MALRNIVMDGDPVLKKKCRPVTDFNDRLATLLDDMADTMLENDGLGLAGPQVGVMRRMFVALDESSLPPALQSDTDEDEVTEEEMEEALEGDWEPKVLEFVNPEVIEQEDEVLGYEGCLSFPGKFAAIKRPKRVKVRAQDRNGKTFEYEGTGTFARCLCHETNHLDGVTIDELAEYFYDPEVPHELDAQLTGTSENQPEEDGDTEA